MLTQRVDFIQYKSVDDIHSITFVTHYAVLNKRKVVQGLIGFSVRKIRWDRWIIFRFFKRIPHNPSFWPSWTDRKELKNEWRSCRKSKIFFHIFPKMWTLRKKSVIPFRRIPLSANIDPSLVVMATHLIFMARTLAVLCEGAETLIDERNIVFIDVEAKKSETSGCTSTYAVQEGEGFDN